MIPKSIYLLWQSIAYALAFITLLPLTIISNTIDISRAQFPIYLVLLFLLNIIEIYLMIKMLEFIIKNLKIKLDTLTSSWYNQLY